MKLLDLTGLSYFFSKVKTYVDKVIDEERQENGVKSVGRYIQINAEGRRFDDTPRNTTPTEVPFDIYPDVYNKGNIGGVWDIPSLNASMLMAIYRRWNRQDR